MRIVLAAITIPLLIATLVGLIWLWPGESQAGTQPLAGEGAQLESVVVTEIVPVGDGIAQPDGSVDVDPYLGAEVSGELLTGPGEGQTVPLQVPGEIIANGLEVGDRIKVVFTADAMGEGSPYAFWDFHRESPMIWLTLAYLLVVFAVARWKGLSAVLGLAACLGIIVAFILPAIMAGESPIAVVIVGSAAMLLAAVYLAHGISIRTTTALLGTFAGLVITVLLGAGALDWTFLTGADSENALMVGYMFPGLSLRHLLLCGLVISSLGALNDVTITQASAVWEVHAANPQLSRARLFASGMRIGRDHIASTIYTLAFAYVGGALGFFLIARTIDATLPEFLVIGEIAEEIVRTLVASIGLMLAIPFTTALAAVLVPASRRAGHVSEHDDAGGTPA